VELCGSILFLTELCQAVEAGIYILLSMVIASVSQFSSVVNSVS
jgi:hypothetical protein